MRRDVRLSIVEVFSPSQEVRKSNLTFWSKLKAPTFEHLNHVERLNLSPLRDNIRLKHLKRNGDQNDPKHLSEGIGDGIAEFLGQIIREVKDQKNDGKVDENSYDNTGIVIARFEGEDSGERTSSSNDGKCHGHNAARTPLLLVAKKTNAQDHF